MTLAQQLPIAFQLTQNVALVVLGAMGYGHVRHWLQDRLPHLAERALFGAIFGVLGILSMLAHVEFVPNVWIDFRAITVAVATLFGRIEAGLVTLVIVELFGAVAGGVGPEVRATNALLAFGLSAAVAVFRHRRASVVGWIDLVCLGLAFGAIGLGVWALWPQSPIARPLLLSLAPTWFAVVTLATLSIGGAVLFSERQRLLTRALRERDADLRSILDNAPISIFLKDRDGRFRIFNRRFVEWARRLPEEIQGKTVREFYPPSIAEMSEASDRQVLDEGNVISYEWSGEALQLGIGYFETIKFPVRDETGAIIGMAGVILDVSAQKRADLELREVQKRLQAIMDNAPLAIFLKDREGRFRLINRGYTDWFGDRPEDVYGRTAAELYSPFIAEGSEARDRQVLEQGRTTYFERPIEKAKPGIEHVIEIKFPIRGDDGKIVGVAGFIADITEQKAAEAALRESRALLREVIDTVPATIAVRDRDSRFVLVNAALAKFHERDVDWFPGRSPAELYEADYVQRARLRDQEVFESGRRQGFYETDFRGRDGQVTTWLASRAPIRDAKGSVRYIVSVGLDITEARRAEEARRHSEKRFRALIEHSNDIIVVVQPDGMVTYRASSPDDAHGYGSEDLLGPRLLDVVHPDDVGAMAETLRTLGAESDRRATGRVRMHRKNGQWRHIAWSARNAADVPGVAGIIFNARDVTEAQELEEQLAQARKMEAVGQLAGGIAHDFNNILGAILGFTSFLVQDLNPNTAQYVYADRIMKASERGRDLIQQITAFSRAGNVERRAEDLCAIVRETSELLRGSLLSSGSLSVAIEEEPLVASVNGAQIHRVLLNLCLNARDALAGRAGEIAIHAGRLEATSPLAHRLPKLMGQDVCRSEDGRSEIAVGAFDAGQRYARIAVVDSGEGMSEPTLLSAFEPFFTTKGRGRGTGLGLAVVRSAVIAAGAALRIVTAPNNGTTVEIFIPLIDGKETLASNARTIGTLSGHERILVIDDEQDIADVVSIGLERLGYEVATVQDPAEAMEIFKEDPEAWDVVISDQVMPGMHGLELLAALKRLRPSVHFILCTGFSDEAIEGMALEAGAGAFFLKPVAPEQLAAAVRRLMG